jgi:hypothetical protein
MSDFRDTLTNPILRNNPIALQILGICSALAVTSSLQGDPGDVRGTDLRDRVLEPVHLHDPPAYSRQPSASSCR